MAANTPSTEDRIWAVLSHLSAIAFGMGLLLPVIGWSEQRRKSKYASFQCLQALGYQSLGYTVWLLTYLLLVIAFLVVMLAAAGFAGDGGNNFDTFMGIWMGFLLFIVFGTFGMYFLFPVIAAISCALGRDFRYPIMGERLARYLGYDPTPAGDEGTWLIEDHEDRWVAAMGHISVIIMLWGMLAPLTTWILQGRRGLFLRFQSIQTLAYQAGATLLYMGSGVIYMFGFVIFIALTGFEGGLDGTSPAEMAGLVALIVSMLAAMLVILIVPLLHILGQWAGYRLLKGDNYRYPWIGRLVEKWIANKTPLAEDGGSSLKGKSS